jgi:hypothetical protein
VTTSVICRIIWQALEGFVTLGIKELGRNFDHRTVGIGFVAVGHFYICRQLPSPSLTIMAENIFLSYHITKCTTCSMHDTFAN